jgi:hypothetical protein
MKIKRLKRAGVRRLGAFDKKTFDFCLVTGKNDVHSRPIQDF